MSDGNAENGRGTERADDGRAPTAVGSAAVGRATVRSGPRPEAAASPSGARSAGAAVLDGVATGGSGPATGATAVPVQPNGAGANGAGTSVRPTAPGSTSIRPAGTPHGGVRPAQPAADGGGVGGSTNLLAGAARTAARPRPSTLRPGGAQPPEQLGVSAPGASAVGAPESAILPAPTSGAAPLGGAVGTAPVTGAGPAPGSAGHPAGSAVGAVRPVSAVGYATPGAPASAPPAQGPGPGSARTQVGDAVRSARATVTAAASRGPRRARLQLKRIDPWSVMKFSFAVSLVLFIILVVATSLLYITLDGIGVIESINRTVSTFTANQETGRSSVDSVISAKLVIGGSALLGAFNMVLFTALATLGAFIYNVCADLVGGVEMTLAERD